MGGNVMGSPVVPPSAIPRESVRTISNCSTCRSASSRYSVPASAWVMRLAATSMVSSRRLMSCSLESAMPMAFSSSSLRSKSSADPAHVSAYGGCCDIGLLCAALLDTDGAHLVDVGNAGQHLFNAVLLQGAHPLVERGGEHFCDAR